MKMNLLAPPAVVVVVVVVVTVVTVEGFEAALTTDIGGVEYPVKDPPVGVLFETFAADDKSVPKRPKTEKF